MHALNLTSVYVHIMYNMLVIVTYTQVMCNLYMYMQYTHIPIHPISVAKRPSKHQLSENSKGFL